MEETLVFIDEGFLSKISKFFGEGKYLRFDKIQFSKDVARKENLFCKHIFYYTAPPFQSGKPTELEIKMKRGYDKFIKSLNKNKIITIREGRVQKIFNEKGELQFKQKGVDTLMTMDLGRIKDDFPEIKKIIIISSDTDFCPIIRNIRQKDKIKVILGTYFDKKRKSEFSLSNELIDCCEKYFKLNKQDLIKEVKNDTTGVPW